MTARALLLRHITELSDEDVETLLGVAERLRAKYLSPPVREVNVSTSAAPPEAKRHPERFGGLSGSVVFEGDVESPVIDAAAWTSDERNFGS